MADAYVVLGQAIPAANTLTDLITVPSSTSEVVSSIVVCNQNTVPVTYRISVAIAGAADTPAQYLYYDAPLFANDTFVATIGVTLATTDVLRCRSDLGNVSFNCFGDKVT